MKTYRGTTTFLILTTLLCDNGLAVVSSNTSCENSVISEDEKDSVYCCEEEGEWWSIEDRFQCGDIKILNCFACRCGSDIFYDYDEKECDATDCFEDSEGAGNCLGGTLKGVVFEPDHQCPFSEASCFSKLEESNGLNSCYNLFRNGNNGEYDCISRTDDSAKIQELNLENFKYVEECSAHPPDSTFQRFNITDSGLQCGEICILKSVWCLEYYGFTCDSKFGDFKTNDFQLCRNTTFWEDIKCDVHLDDGSTRKGRRCIGKMQHCYYPWYERQNFQNTDFLQGNCTDFTDQIFEVGHDCSASKLVSKFCNETCDGDNSNECQEICLNPRKWIEAQTQKSLLDPHNCQGSCQNPEEGCIACSNESYHQCERNGVKVCLNPQLKCDGHPQCDDASDELFEECYLGFYIKEKILKPEATLICNSTMHKSK